MSNSVAGPLWQEAGVASRAGEHTFSLYGPDGRKYLNRPERGHFLEALDQLPRTEALFGSTLAWSGGRISEVLAVVPASFQFGSATVTLPTLKQRRGKRHTFREVPLPPALLTALDAQFHLEAAQRDPIRAGLPLWRFHRVTAWRVIKGVMTLCHLVGPKASPRGLRHAFGVSAVLAGVPLPLLQKWMGHARMSTTAIYTAVVGPEERAFAERFWAESASYAPQASGELDARPI